MTTESARTHTWGCDEHSEDTYEGCHTCDLRDFSNASARKDARIAQLEAGLRDAIEAVDSWAGYASEYFQQKHDLEGDIERLRAVLGN
jgi:hypothetical protein